MAKKYEDETSKALAKAKELKKAGKTQAAKSALRAARNKSIDDSKSIPTSFIKKGSRVSLVPYGPKRPEDAVGGPNARRYQKYKKGK